MKKLFFLRFKNTTLLILLLITGYSFAMPVPTCSITKQNGSSCYSTTLTSVTANLNGTYTIVLTVVNNGSPGPACKTLSHYSVEGDDRTYSNESVNVVSGGMTYDSKIAEGNLGASTPFRGFKIDNTSGIGDSHAGIFTVTYTLTTLQDQQTDASAGGADNIAAFTIADFQSVLSCPQRTGPTAVNDATTTPLNIPVVIDVLANDIAGSSPIDNTSVTFVGTIPDPETVGVFSFNSTTHLVTFTPATGYTGIATVSYKILDGNNLSSTATITVTIISGPTAVNDATTTPLNTSVDIDVLANDVAGSSPIENTSATFVGTIPDPETVGVFKFNSTTHIVTFTPATGFTGIATVNYKILDGNNLSSTATIKVTIITSIINNFPATAYGTLAFEDLWPAKGDYDFNDLVLDYKFEITSNSNNFVDKVVGTFVIKAFGASFENGFGFQLPAAINATDLVVTGYSLTDGYIQLNSNGTESGQANPTIIVYDNAFKQMTHPGVGIGINTDPIAPYVTPKTLTVTINFKPNTYTLNNLDIANFNPFLIVNKVRGVEVHLPNYSPTSLADPSLFGTADDTSDPAQNRYYKNANNLPWAINIYEQFNYPKEKIDIIQTYLHFADWATSGGTLYQNWYQNQPGYRNAGLIYQKP